MVGGRIDSDPSSTKTSWKRSYRRWSLYPNYEMIDSVSSMQNYVMVFYSNDINRISVVVWLWNVSLRILLIYANVLAISEISRMLWDVYCKRSLGFVLILLFFVFQNQGGYLFRWWSDRYITNDWYIDLRSWQATQVIVLLGWLGQGVWRLAWWPWKQLTLAYSYLLINNHYVMCVLKWTFRLH